MIQLKTGMNFLGHAICAGCCPPHKSTSAPQGDVWHPPPQNICIIGKSIARTLTKIGIECISNDELIVSLKTHLVTLHTSNL